MSGSRGAGAAGRRCSVEPSCGRPPSPRRGRGAAGAETSMRTPTSNIKAPVDETEGLASDSCIPSFPTPRRAILPRTCKRTKHRRWPRAGLCLASTQFQAPCTSFFPPIMLPSPSLVRMRCLYAYSAPVFWTFILHVSLLSSLPGTFQNRIVLFMCTMSAMS